MLSITRLLTYVGLMLASFWSWLLLTKSLLIKSPMGCDHFFPLGAVRSTSILADRLAENCRLYRTE
jgi:hypothetical protein